MAGSDVESDDDEAPDEAPARAASARPRRRPLREQREREDTPTPLSGLGKQHVSAWMLAAAVVGSVLAIGSVHLPALAVVAVVVFAATVLAVARSAEARAGLPRSLPVLAGGALVAYTLIQAAPMPIAWLRVIAPANADVWERCLMPFGEAGPRWASISLDPGATLVEALKWSVYGAVFVTSAMIAARRGAAWGVAVVFASASFAALTTLGHGLLSATSVFGLYQPASRPLAWHVGPLLNPNNLSGYLNLGALAGLGILLMHRPVIPRWLTGLGVALIVGIDVAAASRAGFVTLPLGVIALALLTRTRRGGKGGAPRWPLYAAIAGGAALAILGGTREIWDELYDKNLSKLEMMLWAKPLLEKHAWLGIGRGAFESAFPVYRPTPGNLVYTHAENFAAQWASEWGLPVTVIALVALGWAFWPTRLGAERSALAAGGWVGVAVLLVQNLADLALEVPGVCIAAAMVLGSLWGDARRRRSRDGREDASWLAQATSPAPPSDRAALRWAVGIGVAGAAVLAAAIGWGARAVSDDRTAIRAAYDAAGQGLADRAPALRADLRAAMLRHPAEPYFPLMGGLVAFRLRDQSPIPWIQRTLERGEMNGRAHLLLAEVLAGRATRKQALLELRLSAETDPGLIEAVAGVAVRLTKTFDELLVVVPEGKLGAPVLIAIANHLPDLPDTLLRDRCDTEASRRDPSAVLPHLRLAEERLKALTAGSTSPLCPDRELCRREVRDQAKALGEIDPTSSSSPRLLGRLFIADGQPGEAVKLLDKACEEVVDRLPCLAVRVTAASQVTAIEPLEAAAKALMGAACTTQALCAEMASWLGALHTGRNEGNTALAYYKRAARDDPTDKRLEELAAAASRVGSHGLAEDTLRKLLVKRGGNDPEIKRRLDEEHVKNLGRGAPDPLAPLR